MDVNTNARRLDPVHPYKPLDFGNGRIAGSVTPDGRLLALGTYHPVHGYVTLSACAPFPDDRRHDQAAVRAYRAALAQPDAPSFGLRLMATPTATDVYLLADAIPHSRFTIQPETSREDDSVSVRVTTWAPRVGGESISGVFQVWRFHNPTGRPVSLEYTWEGPLALAPASYTQLTESGSLPPQSTTALHLSFAGRELNLVAPEVAAARIVGLPPGPAWRRSGDGPLRVAAAGRLTVPPRQATELTLIHALGQTPEQVRAAAAVLEQLEPRNSLTATLDRYRARWRTLDPNVAAQAHLLAHRAQAYVLDCCTLPVEETLCMLTDHQVLPMSWNRDAYFMLQGLRPATDATTLDLMRRHLLWLFDTAQRPNGYWGRAYLANGRPKDQIFQLDQQCYPLLELAEYAALTEDVATIGRLEQHIPHVLDAIVARRAADAVLFSTEETPADDPLSVPYHFSSQVLLWHTLRQLAALNARRSFTSLDLAGLAQAIHAATWNYLVAEHEGQPLFAYATDLQGTYRFYHDANDLPTVLAPLWGFCSVDDPIWRATMEFAFSPANEGGYYFGSAGGLGSVHTPGAWPLGDVQELLYARMTEDSQRARATLRLLATTACWDGALPETRDETSGAVRSRHWFAWPNAALVAGLAHPAWKP